MTNCLFIVDRDFAPVPGRLANCLFIVDRDFAPVPGRFDKPLRISTVLVEPYVMELNYSISDDPFRPRYEGMCDLFF